MSHSFPIVFEPEPIVDRVSVALVPIDAFTRAPVRRGVTAQLLGADGQTPLPDRAIRNPSGHLVFVNLPEQAEYRFRVDPGLAGYLGPFGVTFTPIENEPPRLHVELVRRPDAAFDAGITLVRGMLVHGGDPAGGVRVFVVPPPGDLVAFATRSDERGVFALPVRLPPVPGEVPAPVQRTIRCEAPLMPTRLLQVELMDGETHVFASKIEMNDGDTPPFASPQGG